MPKMIMILLMKFKVFKCVNESDSAKHCSWWFVKSINKSLKFVNFNFRLTTYWSSIKIIHPMDQISFHCDVVILLKFWNHQQVRRMEKRGKFKAVKTLIFTFFALSYHLTFDAFLKDFHCLIVNLVGFLYTGKKSVFL